MIAAGIGCRRGCDAAEIVAAVRAAELLADRGASVLAVPAFKSDEAAIAQAAAILGVRLVLVGDEAMAAAQPNCQTRSDLAAARTGFASVAEAAALAATGGVLRQARISVGPVTCALAEAPSA